MLIEVARQAIESEEDPKVLRGIIYQLVEAIEELRKENVELKQRISELEEQNRPPAAPFRKKEKSINPQRPGQKKGHPGAYRKVPEAIDEKIKVDLERCPDCGNPLAGVEAVVQYIEDLPQVKPYVTELTTYEGYCGHCEQKVRSRHPKQMSEAQGCAKVALGARAIAAAVELKHGLGLTMRKTCRALEMLCGLKVTAGGLAQAYQRSGKKLESDYTQLRHQLSKARVVHSDETSWWVNGPKSLWVFAKPGADGITFYKVVEHRDRSTFYEVIAPDFQGVLVSDCLSVYDQATALQHKCYAHHLKALKEAEKNTTPTNSTKWLQMVKNFFQSAMKFKKQMEDMDQETRMANRRSLEIAAAALFKQPQWDPAQECFRARIFKQLDHLLVFLDHQQVDATNNLAERQLRPAVIARKLSCGNKTREGADAWQILASLSATCRQRGLNFLDFLIPRLPLLHPS